MDRQMSAPLATVLWITLSAIHVVPLYCNRRVQEAHNSMAHAVNPVQYTPQRPCNTSVSTTYTPQQCSLLQNWTRTGFMRPSKWPH